MTVVTCRFGSSIAAGILSAYGVFMHFILADRANGVEHIHLFITDLIGIKRYRRFHGHHAQDLQNMVLHHITQGAGTLIVSATAFQSYAFRCSDLYVFNKIAGAMSNRYGYTSSVTI